MHVADYPRSGSPDAITVYRATGFSREYRRCCPATCANHARYYWLTCISDVGSALGEASEQPEQLLGDVRGVKTVTGGASMLSPKNPEEAGAAFIEFFHDP